MRPLRSLPAPAPAALPRFNVLAFLRDLATPTATKPRCAWCGAALTDPTSCALCGWQERPQDGASPSVALPNYQAPWHRFLSTRDVC